MTATSGAPLLSLSSGTRREGTTWQGLLGAESPRLNCSVPRLNCELNFLVTIRQSFNGSADFFYVVLDFILQNLHRLKANLDFLRHFPTVRCIPKHLVLLPHLVFYAPQP